MQPKKEILLCYLLILLSAGVIIAAEQPTAKKVGVPCTKSCSNPVKKSSPAPLNFITEGIFRYKA
jgi:hypothetical protein